MPAVVEGVECKALCANRSSWAPTNDLAVAMIDVANVIDTETAGPAWRQVFDHRHRLRCSI